MHEYSESCLSVDNSGDFYLIKSWWGRHHDVNLTLMRMTLTRARSFVRSFVRACAHFKKRAVTKVLKLNQWFFSQFQNSSKTFPSTRYEVSIPLLSFVIRAYRILCTYCCIKRSALLSGTFGLFYFPSQIVPSSTHVRTIWGENPE